MKLKTERYRRVSSWCLMLCLSVSAFAVMPASAAGDNDKMTAEDVIAKHLAALGTPEARAAVKSILALGAASTQMKVGGTGTLGGSVVMASTSNRNLIGIDYNITDYRTEKMAFNGKKLSLAQTKPGTYPNIAKFLKTHEMPMRDGIMGGVLSTAWPLLNATGGVGKLKFNGTKKIDGRDVYVLRYESKNSGGLVTSLYFDAQSFRHVGTDYERHESQQGVTAAGQTQAQGDAIWKMSERFSDFAPENGLDLPHTYHLELSLEAMKERFLQDWTISLSKFVFNKVMGDDQFDAEAVATP